MVAHLHLELSPLSSFFCILAASLSIAFLTFASSLSCFVASLNLSSSLALHDL